MLALSGVGVQALLTVRAVSHDGRVLADAQTLLSHQQSADMSHDALRSDVLSATSATPVDPAAAVVEASREAETLRDGLAATPAELSALQAPELAAEYVQTRDLLAVYALAAERLVAISADRPAALQALPGFNALFEQARDRMGRLTLDLQAHVDRANAAAVHTASVGRTRTWGIFGVCLLILIGLTGAVRRSVRASLAEKRAAEAAVQEANDQLRHDSAREKFNATIKDALEMAATESEATEVVRRAVQVVVPVQRAELLLADNSGAHLERVMTEPAGDAPGCGVSTPSECVAVRRGRTADFDSAGAIASCPKLAVRAGEIGHAVCAPVTFLGEGLGVLHVVARPGDRISPDAIRELSFTADQTGNRIGTLRAFSRSQVQANTDGLTGLLNRRSAEESVSYLQRSGRSLAVALCDLDHFKAVNDTFGHEAGDRALRIFSATLRTVMREGDVVARYGGEEFLLVMPDCSLAAAEQVLGRIRTELALTLGAGGAPTFTASFGLALAEPSQTLEDVVRLADAALLQAKRDGRNRVVTAGTSSAANL